MPSAAPPPAAAPAALSADHAPLVPPPVDGRNPHKGHGTDSGPAAAPHAPLQGDLPDGWELALDDRSGRLYFVEYASSPTAPADYADADHAEYGFDEWCGSYRIDHVRRRVTLIPGSQEGASPVTVDDYARFWHALPARIEGVYHAAMSKVMHHLALHQLSDVAVSPMDEDERLLLSWFDLSDDVSASENRAQHYVAVPARPRTAVEVFSATPRNMLQEAHAVAPTRPGAAMTLYPGTVETNGNLLMEPRQ
ncbi:hypothetical protein GGF31_008442 [Allomyces arbusculus]|nr:hypothetical protein GGF31_008442 [Allomyces arbusculus]